MKSAVLAPAILTLLLSQKSNRTFPTALVGQAQPVLPQMRLKRLAMETLGRAFGRKPSQSHPVYLLQRQNCSLRCFERYLLGAAHRSLPDAEQQILPSKDFIFVFPFLWGGRNPAASLPEMFLPYFFPVACSFSPVCAPLGPALCCCALTFLVSPISLSWTLLTKGAALCYS